MKHYFFKSEAAGIIVITSKKKKKAKREAREICSSAKLVLKTNKLYSIHNEKLK